jgi:condensin-2 complex subunit G2
VAKHASDTRSSAVRAAAVNIITALLDLPQSHAVLRNLLPSFGNLIHDKVEKVRLAVVKMLHRIKTTRGIKYFHVVPVDHLTARLSEEGRKNATGPVASSLTALMSNSYFPQGPNVTGDQQIGRTIKFLTNDPRAAAVFYANLADHVHVNAVAELIARLFLGLDSAVETEKKQQEKENLKGKKRRRFGKKDKDNDEDSEEDDEAQSKGGGELLSATNTSLMASIAETISVLWQSIESQLKAPSNEDYNEQLQEAFTGPALTKVLTHFERKAQSILFTGADDAKHVQDDCYRVCAAVLRSAGRLPAQAVDGLVPYITSVLACLPESESLDESRKNVTAHITLLCLWDMTEQVARSLATSIESAYNTGYELNFGSPETDSRKRKSGRRSKSKTDEITMPALPPRLALIVLRDILQGSDPMSVAARESILLSPSASNVIEKALEHGTKYAERLLDADSVSIQTRECISR